MAESPPSQPVSSSSTTTRRCATSSRSCSRRRDTPCTAVSSAEAALDAAQAAEYSLVISDVRMPGKDGFWFLDRVRELHPDMAVVMLTAFGDTEAAVECSAQWSGRLPAEAAQGDGPHPRHRARAGRRRLELARQRYRKSLENRVREKTAELSRTLGDLQATYSQTLWSLVAALDAREHETSDHSQRVVQYTLAVAGGSGSARRICRHRARGAAARHRQDRRARRDPPEAREAHAGRVGRDAQAPPDRLQHPAVGRVPRRSRAGRALATRSASTAAGIPAGSPARHPDRRPDLRDRGLLRRDDERPAVSQGRHRRGRARRDRALRRHAVRSALRRRVPVDVAGRARRLARTTAARPI